MDYSDYSDYSDSSDYIYLYSMYAQISCTHGLKPPTNAVSLLVLATAVCSKRLPLSASFRTSAPLGLGPRRPGVGLALDDLFATIRGMDPLVMSK